jgi:hypothetical protein
MWQQDEALHESFHQNKLILIKFNCGLQHGNMLQNHSTELSREKAVPEK